MCRIDTYNDENETPALFAVNGSKSDRHWQGKSGRRRLRQRGRMVKNLRAMVISAFLCVTACGESGTVHNVAEGIEEEFTKPMTIAGDRLACLELERVDEIAENVASIREFFDYCRDELLGLTSNLQLSEDHLRATFAMFVAHAFAPYGSSQR